jgi:hypothetical protein
MWLGPAFDNSDMAIEALSKLQLEEEYTIAGENEIGN